MNIPKSCSALLAGCIVFMSASCRPALPLKLTPGRSAALPPGAAQMLRLCSRPAPAFEDSWKLHDADVEQLERDLPRLMRSQARGCCFRGASVDDVDAYFRQYIGLIINGRRYIYINAFPVGSSGRRPGRIPPPHWQRDPYDVCDGGSHWGVLYDVTSRRFTDLSFNGF